MTRWVDGTSFLGQTSFETRLLEMSRDIIVHPRDIVVHKKRKCTICGDHGRYRNPDCLYFIFNETLRHELLHIMYGRPFDEEHHPVWEIGHDQLAAISWRLEQLVKTGIDRPPRAKPKVND